MTALLFAAMIAPLTEGAESMKRPRRNHSAAFKAKVALAAIKGDQTLVQRRAAESGATPAEIHQALLLSAPTIGFPNVIAALSWAEDVLGAKG